MTGDGLALLTGPDAGELLAAALATDGLELVDWQVDSVDVRAGRVSASWLAVVRDGAGTREQWLGGSVPAPGADAPGLLRLSDGDVTAGVWVWPRDPELPALPAAVDPASVRSLLASFGAPDEPVRLEVVVYRPGRRAVVRAVAPSSAVYLKVGRPGRARDLHARHALLSGAGVPSPRSLGWTDDGLLVLSALPGTSLRDALAADAPLPGAEEVLGLLDRLPAGLLDLPRRPSWSDGAAHYAEAVAGVLPAAGARARAVADAVTTRLARADSAPGPVHGDLYEAQLLVEDGRLTGLLDVDTAGPGRRADDLACALAHLDVLAGVWAGTPAAARCAALLEAWLPAFRAAVDPGELAARTAGVVLSLATGPHRVQDPDWPEATVRRLALAETWLRER